MLSISTSLKMCRSVKNSMTEINGRAGDSIEQDITAHISSLILF